MNGMMWPSNRRNIFRIFLHEAQNGECHLCGKAVSLLGPGANLDHLKPKSQGGSDEIWNFGLSHNECNFARGVEPLTRDQQAFMAFAQHKLAAMLAEFGLARLPEEGGQRPAWDEDYLTFRRENAKMVIVRGLSE